MADTEIIKMANGAYEIRGYNIKLNNSKPLTPEEALKKVHSITERKPFRKAVKRSDALCKTVRKSSALCKSARKKESLHRTAGRGAYID